MLEWIAGIDQATIQGWLGVAMGALALWKWWRTTTDEAYWSKVRALIPDAHRLAERAAKLTPTPKDDLFIENLGKLLTAVGIDLQAEHVGAVKLMGSAEHQDYQRVLKSAEGNSEGGS